MVLGESLRSQGSAIAQRLRKAGRRVDLVLEAKKMKWVFKVRVPVCALLHPPYQRLLYPWHRHQPIASNHCMHPCSLLVGLCTACCQLLMCAISSCSKQSAVVLSA